MKPLAEKPAVPQGRSLALLNRRLDDAIPSQWHYHREYELTLIMNSRGQRFVGDHVGNYGDGELVLIGPDLPHSWASTAKLAESAPHVAFTTWFRAEWIEALTEIVPELAVLGSLLRMASRGVRFSDKTVAALRPAMEAIHSLDPAGAVFALLDALVSAAGDSGAMALASPRQRRQLLDAADRPRIERVLDHIHARYREHQKIDDLAALAQLSASGLQRLFRRHTGMTILDYIAQLRIGLACQLLASTAYPIAHIAAYVGYDNLSHFNRQFRTLRHTVPRVFRRDFSE